MNMLYAKFIINYISLQIFASWPHILSTVEKIIIQGILISSHPHPGWTSVFCIISDFSFKSFLTFLTGDAYLNEWVKTSFKWGNNRFLKKVGHAGILLSPVFLTFKSWFTVAAPKKRRRSIKFQRLKAGVIFEFFPFSC